MVVLEEEVEEDEEEEDDRVSEADEDEVSGAPGIATVALVTTEEARNEASVGRLIIDVPGVDCLPACHLSGSDLNRLFSEDD